MRVRVAVLVASLLVGTLPVAASDSWTGTSASLLVVQAGTEATTPMFNADAALDAAQVVDLRPVAAGVRERIAACMARRTYTLAECGQSVADGEF